MGLIYTEIALSNPSDGALAPLQAQALVDSGAINLCIPERIAEQLKLEVQETREVITADAKRMSVDYVGPVKVSFANRSCFTGALILGNSVLLGAIPMEDMDLIINPREQKLTVNPESPNTPSAIVMNETFAKSPFCLHTASTLRRAI